jgi:hypothetical protein
MMTGEETQPVERDPLDDSWFDRAPGTRPSERPARLELGPGPQPDDLSLDDPWFE